MMRSCTFVLFGAIAEAAVETYASGFPARWWVVSATALYSIAIAAFWKRMAWATKAWASCLFLLVLLALTSWLPGGTTNGVRMLGLSTSRVLSLTAAAEVVLAGLVLIRLPRIPRAARAVMGVLAAYGALAFLRGAIAGTPFPALLGGQSFSQALPLVLQGAVVGGFIVLPLALAASLTTAGFRTASRGSAIRVIRQAAALVACLAIVTATLPRHARLREAAAVVATSNAPSFDGLPAPSPERLAALENSLRAIDDGLRDSARDRWDPDYVVQQLGTDPHRLLQWVRDNTSWVPYKGVLRGPVGVLMDRLGNSLDRAILLAVLLQKAGHRVRLAGADLAATRARDVIPLLTRERLVNAAVDMALPATSVDMEPLGATYQFNVVGIRQTLSGHSEDASRVAGTLNEWVSAQTKRLIAALPKRGVTADWNSRFDHAVDAVQDHWWVQRLDGERWIDMDLLPSSAGDRPASVRETAIVEDLSASLYHELAIRVVVEEWTGEALRRHTILAHTLRPSAVIGKPIVLQFWPVAWPTQFATPDVDPAKALREAFVAQREWRAALFVGAENAAEALLKDTGPVAPTGGGPMGGLGRRLAESLSGGTEPEDSRRALTAVWLEYEVRVPGEAPRTITRTVFDLAGSFRGAATPSQAVVISPAAALERSLSLMRSTEILMTPSRLAPDYVMHSLGQAMKANADVLRSLVRRQLSTDFKTPEDLAKRLAPVPGPLHTLALARFELGLPAERTYIDRPNVLSRHTFFAAATNGITLRDAIDIVANEVGVHLNVDDGFLARLEQGVHDTNAEALVWAGPRVLGNTAAAFAASDGWITLAPPDVVESKRVTRPDDVSRRLREDVAAGYIVVAPPAAVRMAQGEFVGWWRIDPRSGHTLGMGGNGWGQSMVEYAATVAASFAAGFLFEYLWCAGGGAGGRPPVTADRRWSAPSTIVPSSWRRFVIVPVHAAGFDECFDLGVISGVLGAALSVFKFTWPLLLRGLGRVVPTFGGPSGAPGGGEPGPGGGGGEPAGEGGGKPGTGGGGTGGGQGETPGQPGKPQAPPAEPAKPASPPKGPYRGDPTGRQLIEENPDSIATRAMGGRELFRGADAAADKAYNTGRGLGMSDEAAHNYSRDAWNRYVAEWRPRQILTPGIPGGRLPEGDPFRQVVGQGGQVGGRELTPDVVGTDQTVAVPGAGGRGGTIQMPPPGGTGKGGTLPLAPPGSGPSETGGAPPGGRGMGGTAPLSPCAQPPCGVSPAAKTAAGIETLDSLFGNRKSGQ